MALFEGRDWQTRPGDMAFGRLPRGRGRLSRDRRQLVRGSSLRGVCREESSDHLALEGPECLKAWSNSVFFRSVEDPAFEQFWGRARTCGHPVPVSISMASADMAGNVREWCSNACQNGRCLRGGAWDDEPYMFARVSQADPFDRSPKNGFRCVEFVEDSEVPELAFEPFLISPRDFYKEEPVSDTAFEIYTQLFSYDPSNLDAEVEQVEETDDWIRQRITFDAAYGNERVIAYLFLPRNTDPPFQTVLYFPGSGAITMPESPLQTQAIGFLLKGGRAVMYPIYNGTYERNEGMDLAHFRPHGTPPLCRVPHHVGQRCAPIDRLHRDAGRSRRRKYRVLRPELGWVSGECHPRGREENQDEPRRYWWIQRDAVISG